MKKRKLTRQETIRIIYAMLDVHFQGNFKKTDTWTRTPNPLLGYLSPSEMIEAGREKKLLKFVKNAVEENVLR